MFAVGNILLGLKSACIQIEFSVVLDQTLDFYSLTANLFCLPGVQCSNALPYLFIYLFIYFIYFQRGPGELQGVHANLGSLQANRGQREEQERLSQRASQQQDEQAAL